MLIVKSASAGVVPYFTDGRCSGRWTPAALHLLGLSDPVEPPALEAVLKGRHPDRGAFLPSVHSRRRTAGWDLVFAAPKSVSLLAATSTHGQEVVDAHRAAVDQVIGYLERRLTVVRRTASTLTAPAGGLIGACFDHVDNAATEPHLHTHVVAANLTLTDRGWSAVRSEGWYIGRRSVAALYQMALRAELRRRDWQLEWRLRADGLADIAEVPTAAIRATSTQSRLAVMTGRNEARQQARPGPWRERLQESGWAPDLSRTAAVGLEAPSLADPHLPARVTARLASRRSDFSASDAIVALAASHAGGSTPEEAAAWVDRFCAECLSVDSRTAGRRWTTPLAKNADERLVELLAMMSAKGPDAVTVLAALPGRSALLAQAEQLHRWSQEWSSQGLRAAVDCTTDLSSARWAVLSGLPAHRRGDRVDVLVVDQADRRSTPDLLGLLGEAHRSGSSVVLVEGGTLPRLTNFASHAMMRFAEQSHPLDCPVGPGWSCSRDDPYPPLTEGLTGRPAAEALLRLWAREPEAALLVGLGVEEVQALNMAARRLAGVAGGGGGGPALGADAPARKGPPTLSPGDRVVVIRARAGLPPYGTFGDVVDTGRRRGAASIRWRGQDRAAVCDAASLTGLRHGWAVTAHMAARLGRPVLLLGSADSVPRLQGLVRAGMEQLPLNRSIGLER